MATYRIVDMYRKSKAVKGIGLIKVKLFGMK